MQRTRRCLALLDGINVAEPVSRLSAFALARTAQRLARSGGTNVSTWRTIAARAIEVAPSMQPGDMSTLLFSFARVRLRDREMMMRVAECAPGTQGSFRAADISYFLGAFARLDVKHRLIFNLFAREVARKLHDFSAAQLGELVYSYARLDMRHDLLFDVLKKRILEVVKALGPLQLAMVANGFARLGISDERFFTLLAAEISRKVPDFGGRSLALVANAYARLGVRNWFLLEILGDEVFRKRNELEPQAVALALNAHARLMFQNPVLFDYFAEDVPRRMKSYNLHSLCLIASAFARQGRPAPKLFEKIGDAACKRAASLYPRAVASLVHAFAELDIRHGVFFFNAPSHVAQHQEAYSVDELAMIGRAYGHFLMVHQPLFDTICEALRQRLVAEPVKVIAKGEGDPKSAEAVCRVSSLVWLLEAFARVTIYEADVLNLLCDSLVQRASDLDPSLVVQALKAVAALSHAHPGLIALGSSCLERSSEELNTDELEMLMKALEDLGVLGNDPSATLLLERPKPVDVSEAT